MAELRDLAARAAKLPSQGVATTYRRSERPHAARRRDRRVSCGLKEGEKFDVLAQSGDAAHRCAAQAADPAAAEEEGRRRRSRRRSRRSRRRRCRRAPSPPPNWLDLSKTDLDEDPPTPEPPEEKPVPSDYWSLVRTPGGQSGWVLTRLISMAIPGRGGAVCRGAPHRVVFRRSGTVMDGDQKKPIWLWTTVSGRRAVGLRQLPGVHLELAAASVRDGVYRAQRPRVSAGAVERRGLCDGKGEAAKFPGFSVCVEKAGQADASARVRAAGAMWCVTRASARASCRRRMDRRRRAGLAPAAGGGDGAAESLPKRLKERVKGWFGNAEVGVAISVD